MKTIVKRLFIVIVLVASSSLIKGQIKTCGYYDGYWSEWEKDYFEDLFDRIDYTLPYEKVNGNYSGFCIHQGGVHPSLYSFKFQISNYIEPTKRVKKEHLKSNQWYEYRGIVEYYVNDKYPTAKAVLDNIMKKYEELTAKVADPNIIADNRTWQKLVKEHSDHTPIVEEYKKLKKCLSTIDEDELLIRQENDSELKSMLEEEILSLKEDKKKI